MRKLLWIGFVLCHCSLHAQQKDIRIVFTSDVHFGLRKAHFRNAPDSVTSQEVNRAMTLAMRKLGPVNYIVITGDIANREEAPVQADSTSWKQFLAVYESLHIPMLLLPGNHDVSNAIGYTRPLLPATDATSMVGIYNRMMHPQRPLDTGHFNYATDKVNYSRNIGGIHFMFINIWPDSANRVWMAKDLKRISPQTPVVVFAHDPPEGDPKHFTDPARLKDKYENLLPEVYNTHYEHDWDEFLKLHPNIKGYFHGHSNYTEFYTYKGADSSLALPAFRADSPMKGKYSAQNEKLLSFLVITLHPATKLMEIRECLWNTGAANKWGETKNLQL